MPELPEVHTIACGLQERIAGCTIQDVELRWPGCVRGDARDFARRVQGARINRVNRRAKLVLLNLSPDLVMAVHLKMTGRLYVPEQDLPPDKHTHAVFTLQQNGADDPFAMYFNDTRKFGYLALFTLPELEDWDFYSGLGPEPLEMTADEFTALFKGRRGRIKSLLLDQRFIAGIGNIYADESLHRAGIRPDTTADRVSCKRLTALYAALHAVLNEAIQDCGSSISDYRDAQGNAGAFQNKFLVYGRQGRPCAACGQTLRKSIVAGRTSVYCPRCQKA